MEILSLILIGITAYFLFFGIIFGLKRGFVRSLVRLVTVGVAFAIAWFCKGAYVAAVLDFELNGQSIRAAFDGMAAEMGAISGVVSSLVEIVLGVLLFILVFLVLKFLTAIVSAILGVFFPKGHRGLGLLVGLLQGALIAFCVCAPLNGVLLDMQKIMAIELDGNAIVDAESKEKMGKYGLDLDKYKESGVANFYTSIGKGFYDALAGAENEDGESVTLSGYVDATVATSKLADELTALSEINFENGLTAENRDAISQTFKNLNAIKGDMSKEAKTAVNDMIGAVIADAGEEMPEQVQKILEDFDIEKVDFEKEGDVILDLYDYAQNETTEVTAADLVESLAQSTVILPAIEGMVTEESPIELPEDSRAEVITAINGLSDAAAQESLRKIFGLAE